MSALGTGVAMTTLAMLSGPEKAVLFLLSLEEDVAAPIVSELSVTDLRKLREVASTMREVSPDALDATHQEFVQRSNDAVAVPRGGVTYLKRLAVGALGPQRAHEVFDPGAVLSDPMRRLEQAPPDAVATLLAGESPQLVGAIVARLEASRAAEILKAMSPEREAEVLTRLARMTDLPAGVLEEVATALSDELPSPEAETLINISGVAKAAEILNATGRRESTAVLDAIEAVEPDLALEVRMAMFTFDDLSNLEPRAMRDLLREVPTERLTLALKGASKEAAEAIFAALSERAASLIRDDLEVLGKVRKSEIAAAQSEVVQVALRLEGEGTLDLGRGDE